LIDWGIDPTASSGKRPRRPFYDRLASDKNLAIVLMLLTGAVEETKARAVSHISKYDSYSWLWLKDPESVYKEFLAAQSPILEDFVQELHKFVAVEAEIAEFPSVEPLGCLHLKTDGLKSAFKHETERWKFQYSEKLHQEAKSDMDSVSHRRTGNARAQIQACNRTSMNILTDAHPVLRLFCAACLLLFLS
jgi:dynein heavy chain